MVSDMQNDIAKAILKNADGIIDAIGQYLAKADDDLQKTLKEEGYVEPKETVAAVNSLEEEIVNALYEQTDSLLETLQEAENDGADAEELQRRISALLSADEIAVKIEAASADMYEAQVPKLASVYMEESDGELVVETIRERTSNWIRSWSQRLGELTQISTHEQISSLIENTISEGLSIADLTRKIQEGGWRNEYYQARRYALTETLRAHSVAHEEAIQQSPACDSKEWRHTGGSKNKPRPNHVAMDGQIVPKDKPFELQGRDGTMYYPMYPRDSSLPASESVNCHCIHRGIVNKDVLGLSLDERKALQQKFIDGDNAEWQKELNEKTKSAAGINEDTVFMDALKEKTKEQQIKYCGGKKKWALVESGVVTTDADLKKIRTTTLKDLAEDGILTVGDATLNHSVKGTYKAATKQYPNGRMVSGGHTQAAMEECASQGIEYTITGTFSNGVRIGNVPSSQMKLKKTENGQAWFPENWDDEKVLLAGTSVANNGSELVDGYHKTGVYDNVAVRVLFKDGNIETICPDLDQHLYVEGVEALDG